MRRAPISRILSLQRRQHPAEIEIPRLDQVGHRLGVHEKQLSCAATPASFQPKLSALATMRFELSSKATKMPGSLHSRAPCTRNCSASTVLPEPGPPTSSVVRPRGKPPPVISSKPAMPVGALVGAFTRGDRTDFILFPAES